MKSAINNLSIPYLTLLLPKCLGVSGSLIISFEHKHNNGLGI